MASVFVLTGSMLPFYVPCLHRQVLMQLLGAAGVVELQVRFLALPLGLLAEILVFHTDLLRRRRRS